MFYVIKHFSLRWVVFCYKYKQTANHVPRDVVHKVGQGVLYFQIRRMVSRDTRKFSCTDAKNKSMAFPSANVHKRTLNSIMCKAPVRSYIRYQTANAARTHKNSSTPLRKL